LLESCSASAHLGKVYVTKPDANETDQHKWLTYYQDQLDAYGGNAIRPAGELLLSEGYQPEPGSYNPAAVDGYQQAELEWSVKEKQASTGKAVGFTGLLVAICILPIAIVFPMMNAHSK
jgi:hypothetical protein